MKRIGAIVGLVLILVATAPWVIHWGTFPGHAVGVTYWGRNWTDQEDLILDYQFAIDKLVPHGVDFGDAIARLRQTGHLCRPAESSENCPSVAQCTLHRSRDLLLLMTWDTEWKVLLTLEHCKLVRKRVHIEFASL